MSRHNVSPDDEPSRDQVITWQKGLKALSRFRIQLKQLPLTEEILQKIVSSLAAMETRPYRGTLREISQIQDFTRQHSSLLLKARLNSSEWLEETIAGAAAEETISLVTWQMSSQKLQNFITKIALYCGEVMDMYAKWQRGAASRQDITWLLTVRHPQISSFLDEQIVFTLLDVDTLLKARSWITTSRLAINTVREREDEPPR
jgi:hypothetical protein